MCLYVFTSLLLFVLLLTKQHICIQVTLSYRYQNTAAKSYKYTIPTVIKHAYNFLYLT